MKVGSLVKTKFWIDSTGSEYLRSEVEHVHLDSGSVGVITQMSDHGKYDHRVFFGDLNVCWWVRGDEIEVVTE